MSIQTSYSNARENFASLLKQVEEDREIVIITRKGHGDVALIAADELSSLLETKHLLSSPANARRLLEALQEAMSRKNKATSIEQIRKEFKLDE
jgi:antitoxin YefM